MPRNWNECRSQITDEEATAQLENFLKTGMDATQLSTNEQVQGLNPDAYGAPLRSEEESDSQLWGTAPSGAASSGTQQRHSNAVWDGFRAGREKFLTKVLGSFDASRENAHDSMKERFEHVSNGDYEAHSPLLNESSRRLPAVPESVLDRTKRLLSR